MSGESPLVVTPAEMGVLGKEAIESLHNNRDRMIPLLLPGMDTYFAPLEPGSLTVVQAQTHNGKSWFMRKWSERLVRYLQDKNSDDIIVWVDTEITANYLAMNQMLATAGMRYSDVIYRNTLDMRALLQAAVSVSRQPVYTIATRLGRDGSEVHLTNIRNGLKMLTDGRVDGVKHRIAVVFIDYLQSLPLDPVVSRQLDLSNQRRLQVSRDVDTARVIGSVNNCPVVLGVQSRQILDRTEASGALALPGMYDGQESANIAQRTDRMLSLAVAARNFGKGKTLQYHGHSWTVRDNMMFVRVLKQRGDFPAGAVFSFDMDSAATDPYLTMINTWSEN